MDRKVHNNIVSEREKTGNNPSVHQQWNGYVNYDIIKQWNKQWKNYSYVYQHGWTVTILSGKSKLQKKIYV